jgi:hypothetical protein
MHTKFWSETMKERDHFGDLGTNGRITSIFKLISKKIVFADVGWVYLAQDRVQWRALVNTVLNFRVP